MKTPVFSSRAARSSLFGRGVAGVGADLVAVLGALSEPLDQRVLGRQHEERRAEEGVGPRREDGNVLVELLDPEEDLAALGAADPVPLHRQHALGPDSSSAMSSSSRSAYR